MMLAETDLALGRLVVERSIATEEQVRQCLQIQKNLQRPTNLGAILVHRGVITQDQCRELIGLSQSASYAGSGAFQRPPPPVNDGQTALVRPTVSGAHAMGPLAVGCHSCGGRFAARPEHRGHTVPCPSCKTPIQVPTNGNGNGNGAASAASRSASRVGGPPSSMARPGSRIGAAPPLFEAPTAPPPPPSRAGGGPAGEAETLLLQGESDQTRRTDHPTPYGGMPTPYGGLRPPTRGTPGSSMGVARAPLRPASHFAAPPPPPGTAPSGPVPGDAGFEPLFSEEGLELDEASVAEVADPIARVFGRRVGAEGEVTTFGPYDVLGEIARGGMGIVYKARQRDLKRLVALKILKEGEEATERQVRRFKRETAAAAKLQHPNIVAVHEVGCHAGFHYFTMDLIEGEPLDQIVKRARPPKDAGLVGGSGGSRSGARVGGLDVEWSLNVLEEISRAMHYAHQKNVVHRDLKPANILMDREGHPKITDFGLAKDLDQKSLLTRTGAAVGTPFYMAPEQARGDDDIDKRIDVYALGVILYEMLTGTPPFVGNSTMEIYHKILEEEPVPPRQHNPKIPRDIETIVIKSIEKDRRRRYNTSEELADDIRRYREGEPIHARPVGPIERLVKKAKKNLAVVATVAVAVMVLVPSVIAIGYRHLKELETQRAQKFQLELDRFKEAVKERHLAVESILTTASAKRRDHNPVESLEEIAAAIATLDGIEDLVAERAPDEDDDSVITREDLENHLQEESPKTNKLYRRAHVLAAEAEQDIGTVDALQEALARYAKALEHEPGHGPARHGIAMVHVKLGDLDRALETLQDVLAQDADDHEARLLLGRVLRSNGRLDEAESELERVVREAPDPIKGRIELGRLLLAKGEAERAHDEFEAVLDQQDDSFEGYLGRGRANEVLDWHQEALDDFNEAVDLQPSRPEGYYFRARHHLSQQKTGDALKDFEIATAREDRYYAAWLGLGTVQVWQLEWERAAESFKKITEAKDRASQDFAAEAWLRLGDLYRLQADIGSAVQKRIDEREAKARRSLLQMAGRMRVAQESGNMESVAGQAAKQLGDDVVSREDDLAEAAKDVEKLTKKALDAYAKARELDPHLAEAPLGQAEFLIALGRHDEAKKALAEASETLAGRSEAEEVGDLPPSPLPGGPLPATLPIDARLAFARARLALESEEAKEALSIAQAARTEIAPEFGFLLDSVIGLAHHKLGDEAAAHEALGRATEEAALPGHSIGRLLEAASKSKDSAIRSKKLEYYSRARAYFTRIIDLYPYDARAYLGRARLEVAWKYHDFAQEDFSKAIAAAPFMREAWVERGNTRIKVSGDDTEKITAAETDFTTALELTRAISVPTKDELDALAKNDQPLVEEIKKEARLSLLAKAHVGRAKARAKLDRDAEALVDARASAALAPRVEAAYELLERLLSKRGEPILALAAKMERKAIRAVSRAEAQKHFEKGQQYQNRRSYPEAIAEFDKAIELDPDLSQAYYERGTCYIKIGNFVPGILDLSKALELDPDIANILYEKVYQVSYVVDLNRVIGELNKIVGDHPDESHVVFLRGFFYVAKTELKKFEAKDIDLGIADLDRTIEINPKHLPAFVYRGMLYFKKGELERALEDYDRALLFYEDFGMAHYLKSQALSSQGQVDEAFMHLEKAFKNGFNGYERVKQDDNFEALRGDPRYRRIIGGR